jgi:hypothetical protein
MSGHLWKRSVTDHSARNRKNLLQLAALLSWILPGLFGTPAHATDLKPETVAAFDRYIAATEAQMGEDTRLNRFLIVDRLSDSERKDAYDQLQHGQVYIQEMDTREEHRPIPIPGGLIHHWAGVIFIRKATLAEANAVLHDYDNEPNIYKPDVHRAKLIHRNGDESKLFEQFYSKSIVTVVLNVYFDVVETQLGSTRIQSVSRSTRIAEVLDPGEPTERERTDGKDHGYVWRLNSYWRLEEKDGGVYVENESISLSRTVPVMFSWIITPLTRSIPHDVMLRTLTNTRNAVLAPGTASK